MSTATLSARPSSAKNPPAGLVQTQLAGGVGTITLNHSAKRNAPGQALVGEILAALAELQKVSARVVVLRAAADAKVFSAGHDIDELPRGEEPLPYNDPLETLLRAIKHFPAPVIAMVHGSVWGGATDLVLSCDMIVGDETSSFAITPANLGLAYNTAGLLQCLRRVPLGKVKEMFFTAAPLNADEADKWGILNHLVPAADLEAFTQGLARRIAEKAPLAIAAIKENCAFWLPPIRSLRTPCSGSSSCGTTSTTAPLSGRLERLPRTAASRCLPASRTEPGDRAARWSRAGGRARRLTAPDRPANSPRSWRRPDRSAPRPRRPLNRPASWPCRPLGPTAATRAARPL